MTGSSDLVHLMKNFISKILTRIVGIQKEVWPSHSDIINQGCLYNYLDLCDGKNC